VTDHGPVIPDGWRRRVLDDLAASACPEAGEADGSGEWDEWYRRSGLWSEEDARAGSPSEAVAGLMRRAFLAGWSARDAAERRKAADGLTALTDELGLYDDGREP
jgi:hypothetical protein